MLVLVVFAIQFNQAEEQQRKITEEQTRVVEDLTNADQIRRRILTEIEASLAERGVRVRIDLDNGVVRLPEAILFPSGSAELSPAGTEALTKLANALVSVVPCYTTQPEVLGVVGCAPDNAGKLDAIFIEGHTDDVPIQTAKYPDNWSLSTARAIRTYQTLAAMQPILEQLRNPRGQPVFSVSGYADRRPVAPNDNPEGRQLNRRIDLRFVMVSPTRPVRLR